MATDAGSATRDWAHADRQPGAVLRGLGYLGGHGALAVASLRALVWCRRPTPALAGAVYRQVVLNLRQALPIVILMQIALGAFLAMQAFFDATFREATGAVVGLGMLKDMGSLCAGWVLAGVLAVRLIPELRGPHEGLDGDPATLPDRDILRGIRADERIRPEPARLALARILAGMLTGPVLAVWGSLVGMGIGLVVALDKLAVSPGIYVGMLIERIELHDVYGLLVRSLAFGALAALAACHEGLRAPGDEPDERAGAIKRSVMVSLAGMLVLNTAWFTFANLSGAPFGPVLAP